MFQPSVFSKGPCIMSQSNDAASEDAAAGAVGTVVGLAWEDTA